MIRRWVAALVVCTVLIEAALAAEPPWMARSKLGMVASDSPEASQIGAAVLAGGGNAFEAAIATSLALAVTRPQSTGLGGGGFLVAYVSKDKRFVALDFRESAPAGATAARYAELARNRGDGPSPSVYGGNAIAVPGQVAGLGEIHRRFATRPLRELVQPAIELAGRGFAADEHYQYACNGVLAHMKKWPQLKTQYARINATLLGDGTAPQVGATIARPDLADALRLIAEQGPDAVYKGAIGEAMVKAAQAAGGVLSMADLAAYRVREREPLRATCGAHEIITMPPPSSGGVCILEIMNILDVTAARRKTSLAEMQAQGTLDVALIGALKHGFADRARWLGDPDFARVPVARLVSRAYAEELVERCDRGREEFGTTTLPADQGTSHFCVADKEGNIVAMTETINGSFGSLVVAEPYGIILNNEMDDFSADVGRPNLYGLIQGEANAVAPGKRPLSSMTPMIVLQEGRPVLALGGSGGPCIITSVLQVMLGVTRLGRSLEEAMSALRIHHQWQPDVASFDRDPPAELVDLLTKAGHQVGRAHKVGIVQAIQFLPDGTLVGASDLRKDGRPVGVSDTAGERSPS